MRGATPRINRFSVKPHRNDRVFRLYRFYNGFNQVHLCPFVKEAGLFGVPPLKRSSERIICHLEL